MPTPDAVKRYQLNLRLNALQMYGNKCECCGEETEWFLSIDHKGGGGARHRRQLRREEGHGNIYLWLKKNGYPPGFRVLCYNCNNCIGFNGRCAHEQTLEQRGVMAPPVRGRVWSEEELWGIKMRQKAGESQMALAKRYHTSQPTISRLLRRIRSHKIRFLGGWGKRPPRAPGPLQIEA